MKLNTKKIAIAAVPVVIGAGILIGLNWLSKSQEAANGAATSAALPTVDGSQSAPQDITHEKAALEQELTKKPGHPPILLRLAEIAQQEGHPDQAAAHLQQLLQQDPVNEEARLELGRALFETNDIDGALRETERLVKDHPTNVDGLYNLGAIHANLGHLDQAREFWNKAIAAGPNTESGQLAQSSLGKLSIPAHNVTAKTQVPAGTDNPAIDSRTADVLLDALRRR